MEYIIIFNDLFNNNSKTTCSFNTETERDDYIEKIVSIGLTNYQNIQYYKKTSVQKEHKEIDISPYSAFTNIVDDVKKNVENMSESILANTQNKYKNLSTEQLAKIVSETTQALKSDMVINRHLNLLAKRPYTKHLVEMNEYDIISLIIFKEIFESSINLFLLRNGMY